VAAGGEFHAELGGDYAGAAVGGVAGYAYAHGMFFRVSAASIRAATIQQNRMRRTATTKEKSTGLKDPPLQRPG
jgi:hypothetical protein